MPFEPLSQEFDGFAQVLPVRCQTFVPVVSFVVSEETVSEDGGLSFFIRLDKAA